MTEPFRTAGSMCPKCGVGPLREFNKRLVCDKCAGMLLTADDFAQSIHDVDGSADALEAKEAKPAEAKCPRCTQPMQSATLVLGKVTLDGTFLRCAADGIWVSEDAMVAVYAKASRRGHAGGGGMGSAAASAYMNIAPSGSATGAARGVGAAFGSRSGLPRRATPHVREEFVSAFHGKELACPACKDQHLAFAGDRWTCGGCNGAFVEDKALVPMVEDITHGPWQVPAMKGAAGARKCPVCAEAMVVDKLGTVEIDRCPSHGTWFDQHELGQALVETAEVDPKPGSGVGGWLKRLFT